jgi:hypothetical protein
MSHDQDAADQRVDDVQEQRKLHFLLANNGREWISFMRQFAHESHRLPDLGNVCNLGSIEIKESRTNPDAHEIFVWRRYFHLLLAA